MANLQTYKTQIALITNTIMKGGIWMKKPSLKTVIGFVTAGIAGVVAFISSIQDQKKEERINRLEDRIKTLEENNEAE